MSNQEENSGGFFAKYSEWLIAVGLVAVCLAIYAQTFGFEFINIDDRAYIFENPAVLSGLNSRSVYWAMTAFHSGNWHPVTWLSHMLDVTLFGQNAGMHHATNVLFHSIGSVLSYFAFKRLTGSVGQAAMIAFLFAVHPTHVESVAWVAERRDVLSVVFWMLTMLAYFRYSDAVRERTSSPVLWMTLTAVFFALGLMSKPMLVTLPFALILCDFWSLGRLKKIGDLKGLFIEKIPLFALTAASSVITFLAQSSAGATVALEQMPIGERLANSSQAYAKYIIMMFYPRNLGLSYPIDYPIDPLKTIGSVLLILTVSFYFWTQRSARPYLLMGWLWFLGTLVPVIGLVQVGLQSHADRYTYIPYFGLFLIITGFAGELIGKYRIDKRAVAAAAAIVICVLSGVAYLQASHWRTSETLYTHTLSFTSKNYFLMSNLCLYYVKNSTVEIAERRCTELLEATPPTAEGYNILGLLRTETGRVDDGIAYFEKAIKLRPDWGILHAHSAMALSKAGRTVEAEKELAIAKASTDGSVNRPTLARVMNEFALAMEKRGQTGIALQYYDQAAAADPTFKEATANAARLRGKN
jgi:Tfp pilus assembly protein PilF